MINPKATISPQQQLPQQFMNRGQVVHSAGKSDGASTRRSKFTEDGDGDPPARRFLDRKQLASRWQISVSTLKRREAAGDLKPTRLGPRTVRYAVSHVLEIEEAMRA